MNRPHLRLPWPRQAGLLGRLGLLLLLGACGSAPLTRLHSLLPAQALGGGAEATTPPLAIRLATVVVPVAVDQPQWLLRLPDGTLALLENDRWASPLRDELQAALRDLLAQRWGAAEVPGRPPAWLVAVALTRFESIAGQEARLEGRWTLTPAAGGAGGLSCPAVLREPVAGGTLALAEGHQRAVARLAAQIGRQLQAIVRGERASCDTGAPNATGTAGGPG